LMRAHKKTYYGNNRKEDIKRNNNETD